MTLITRSATIQVRVVPRVKAASEQVLWRIGLTMSEAVELFLRRVIVDERMPFEIVALPLVGLNTEAATMDPSMVSSDASREVSADHTAAGEKRGERRKKKSKKISGGLTSTPIQSKKRGKKRL
ncbi:MAG: type II toxin-antitoxin system RelB/DinJ family antitoxin [Devosia sp.]|nr:type II toxin-antitoxin system RelB/DinJ family antitoxin [Devosia sp.]